MILTFIIIGIVGYLIFKMVIGITVKGVEKVAEHSATQHEEHRIVAINNDRDRLQEEWNQRFMQVCEVPDMAVRVKYYTDYFEKKSTRRFMYAYMWPVEGAIACLPTIDQFDENGNQMRFIKSPLEWKVVYDELTDIRGIYRRDCVTEFHFLPSGSVAYSLDDYEKIKKVYEAAKAMTN